MSVGNSRRAGRALAFRVAIAGLVAAAAIARHEPPRARADASPGDFSAERARRALDLVAGDGRPHPEGSRASADVRNRLIAEFRRMGDVPETEAAFACSPRGTCGDVQNLVVRRPGKEKRKAILLSAHYDSVGAGPGASDDGMGVAAVLEIARALSVRPLRRPVIFLLDDGEEQGLLGAEAFAARPTTRNEILADINLEARGTGGASLLFETSENNAWLSRCFRSLPRPVTSSLFYVVYKTLPNDTDLTVFRRQGIAGVNFACVRGAARYHTPRDDVAHASLATLQHHGENALAMARALDASDREAPPPGDSVYFDLFGAAVARWPSGATLPAALAVAALFSVALGRRWRRGAFTAGEFGRAFAVFPAIPAGAVLLSLAAAILLRRGGVIPVAWIAHPFLAASAFWGAAILSAGAIATIGGGVRRPSAHRWASAAWWVAITVSLAWIAPSASFLFLVPAALWAGGLALPVREEIGGSLAPITAAFFLLPIAWVLLEVLGFRGIAAISGVLALAVTAWNGEIAALESRVRRRIAAGLGASSALLAALSFLPPAFSRDVPQRVTLLLHQDGDRGTTRWLAEADGDALPRTLRTAAPFRAELEFPWAPASRAFSAPAEVSTLPLPDLRLAEDATSAGVRRIRGTLVSRRGATVLRIAFPPAAPPLSLSIGGKALPVPDDREAARTGGWRSYACVTLPPGGILLEIAAPAGPITLLLADRSPGLPRNGADLLRARPVWAVPGQSGDATIVSRTLRF